MIKYDVASAKEYAADGRIEVWVHAYLAEGDWANPGLSEGLKLQTRYWVGPIEMALDNLVRTCGPEPDMPFQVDAAGWELKVTLLARSIQDPAGLPPVIAEYLQGILYVRDGNHRHEALRRYGSDRCWVLIWYNSEKDWREHCAIWIHDKDAEQLARRDPASVRAGAPRFLCISYAWDPPHFVREKPQRRDALLAELRG